MVVRGQNGLPWSSTDWRCVLLLICVQEPEIDSLRTQLEDLNLQEVSSPHHHILSSIAMTPLSHQESLLTAAWSSYGL